eukprot:scaffold93087_cov67-Phaeocystis_antarctica.AAC.2
MESPPPLCQPRAHVTFQRGTLARLRGGLGLTEDSPIEPCCRECCSRSDFLSRGFRCHHPVYRVIEVSIIQAAIRKSRGFNASSKTHICRSPSRDVQPDQLSPASGRDMDDPPRSLGVEHDAAGHLRLDGNGAVDAERRTAFVGAHVVGELVGARHQHDPAHRAIVECRNEVTRADRVPRAGLQRRRGRGRGRRGRRGRRRGRRR